jgi:hypothetical protein
VRQLDAHLHSWVATGDSGRYVPSAVKDLIKEDLALTDSQTSYPTTVRAHICTAMHPHAHATRMRTHGPT